MKLNDNTRQQLVVPTTLLANISLLKVTTVFSPRDTQNTEYMVAGFKSANSRSCVSVDWKSVRTPVETTVDTEGTDRPSRTDKQCNHPGDNNRTDTVIVVLVISFRDNKMAGAGPSVGKLEGKRVGGTVVVR